MAVWGLLDGESVMVRRMRAFAVASEMGLGGVSVAVVATLAWYAHMTWNPNKDVMFTTLNSFQWRLALRANCYALSVAFGPCSVGSLEEGGFLFFAGGGQLSFTYFGRSDDHTISGVSYCGYYGSDPCM